MNSTPLLQIAMDYTSLSKALVMASLVAPEVDIIEIIDAARTQLADLSSELLNQVHSQAHCLDNVAGRDR